MSRTLITYNNKTQSIAGWAREYGIKPATLSKRLKEGWDIERALTTSSAPENIVGQKYNRLTVLEVVAGEKGPNQYVKCLCDCGNIKVIGRWHVMSGNNIACGECSYEKHGMYKTLLYSSWQHMKARCYQESNKHYYNYGGRGISVCDEWRNSFSTFMDWAYDNGYVDGLTIDRIDSDGNYEPSNCRWANRKEQQNNIRTNRLLTLNNKTQTVSQWADELEIDKKTIDSRLRKGWSDEDALTPHLISRKKTYSYNGEIKTLDEWAQSIGMSKSGFRKRLKIMSFEEAIQIKKATN